MVKRREPPIMPSNPAKGNEVISPMQRDWLKWLREKALPVVSLIMVMFSLTMAYFTVTRSLDSASKLEVIADNLTTRYLGDFPDCLEDIAKVLDEAKRGEEITIISDFPGYGIYSNNAAYVSYEAVIRKKVLDTSITMVVLDHNQRMEVLKAQFGPRKIEEIKDSPAFRNFMTWSRRNETNFHTPEDLCLAIEEEQKKVYDSNFSSIKNRCEFPRPLPILLWIVGDRVAVFSIPNLKTREGAVEATFITRDQRLIGQLAVIAQAYSCDSLASGGITSLLNFHV